MPKLGKKWGDIRGDVSEKTVEKVSEKKKKVSEKRSDKIINLIKNNSGITISELANQLGKTTRTVEIQLQKLKQKKRIERLGSDKGGYWQILTDKNEPCNTAPSTYREILFRARFSKKSIRRI